MKLRIKGDSLRLRVSPSELAKLATTGRIEETIHFGPEPDAELTYAFEHSAGAASMTVRYRPQEITVIASSSSVLQWAGGDKVGLYGEAIFGNTSLELIIEKDFACLDRNEEENHDTFPHPQQGAVC